MLLEQCPLCGCNDMMDIPEIGCRCSNCDEVFKYDDRNGFAIVSKEEWIQYLNKSGEQSC